VFYFNESFLTALYTDCNDSNLQPTNIDDPHKLLEEVNCWTNRCITLNMAERGYIVGWLSRTRTYGVPSLW
jgi:hypothetical protein